MYVHSSTSWCLLSNYFNIYNPNIYDIDGLNIWILCRKLSKASYTHKCHELTVPVVWFHKTRSTLNGCHIVKFKKKYIYGFMIHACSKFHVYFLPCFWTVRQLWPYVWWRYDETTKHESTKKYFHCNTVHVAELLNCYTNHCTYIKFIKFIKFTH